MPVDRRTASTSELCGTGSHELGRPLLHVGDETTEVAEQREATHGCRSHPVGL